MKNRGIILIRAHELEKALQPGTVLELITRRYVWGPSGYITEEAELPAGLAFCGAAYIGDKQHSEVIVEHDDLEETSEGKAVSIIGEFVAVPSDETLQADREDLASSFEDLAGKFEDLAEQDVTAAHLEKFRDEIGARPAQAEEGT